MRDEPRAPRTRRFLAMASEVAKVLGQVSNNQSGEFERNSKQSHAQQRLEVADVRSVFFLHARDSASNSHRRIARIVRSCVGAKTEAHARARFCIHEAHRKQHRRRLR